MLTRAQLLGQIMQNYGTPIAIAGTHGKTTTTSMAAQILMAAGSDPTVSVGGILPSIGGNIRVGHSETFITEACEYTNSFLSFFPKISVILNMDADHLDFFQDIDDIRRSFRKFAELLPSGRHSDHQRGLRLSTKPSPKGFPAAWSPMLWSTTRILQPAILPMTSLVIRRSQPFSGVSRPALIL